MRITSLALAGMLLGACAQPTDVQSAAAPGQVPQFPPSEICPDPGAEACADHRMGALPLEAAAGTRVYRETWSGPFTGPMQGGSIVLTIRPDGTRTLQTPWRPDDYELSGDDLPDFEAALARSDFGALPEYNQAVEVCTGGVATTLEAVVDGTYRITHFDYCGGVSSESVAQALDQLFVFSAGLSGLSYPVNPERPTFRG